MGLMLTVPQVLMASHFCFIRNSGRSSGGTSWLSLEGLKKGEINIDRINYAMIILIPKEAEARTLKKYRPISLINCSFKIFSKVLNNRIETLCGRLLAPNQTAFVRGRFILESVVAAHEIVHDTVKGGQKGMILKVDYEKTYDRVD
jgi:hypothetical protein